MAVVVPGSLADDGATARSSPSSPAPLLSVPRGGGWEEDGVPRRRRPAGDGASSQGHKPLFPSFLSFSFYSLCKRRKPEHPRPASASSWRSRCVFAPERKPFFRPWRRHGALSTALFFDQCLGLPMRTGSRGTARPCGGALCRRSGNFLFTFPL
jgi:hypothetical protein